MNNGSGPDPDGSQLRTTWHPGYIRRTEGPRNHSQFDFVFSSTTTSLTMKFFALCLVFALVLAIFAGVSEAKPQHGKVARHGHAVAKGHGAHAAPHRRAAKHAAKHAKKGKKQARKPKQHRKPKHAKKGKKQARKIHH
ncbi:unnamed protein product [Auanema sp. JU1783]|nr:unnamed protein product [Auanema sp. JU1783]